MLEPQKNPYDIFRMLHVAIGTDINPEYVLVFDTRSSEWSAANLVSEEDLVTLALTPNLVAICMIKPEELSLILNHKDPHIITETLHDWASLSRPFANQLSLSDFIPEVTEPPDKEEGQE